MANETLNPSFKFGEIHQVVFLRGTNCARSIMAEALLERFSQGRFQAFSAGLENSGEIHPLTLKLLNENRYATSHLKPKHFRELLATGFSGMVHLISFCGRPSLDVFALFPADAEWMFWNITDPLQEQRDENKRTYQFRKAFRELENRIRLFVLVNSRESSGRHLIHPPAFRSEQSI